MDGGLPDFRLSVLAGIALMAMAACGGEDLTGVDLSGLIEISPEPEWQRIYGEVESCTGSRGDFDRVTWFRATSIRDTLERDEPAGFWLGPEGIPHGIAIHRNRLAEGGEKLAGTVRHEAIHEVLQIASHEGVVWCRCDGRDELFEQC